MSEGWLTESALLPSVPTPIKGVSEGSLKQLRSAVLESKLSSTPRNVSVDTVQVARLVRKKQDEQGHKRQQEQDLSKEYRTAKMQRKSDFYTALITGKRSVESVVEELDKEAKRESDSTQGSRHITADDLLVDFETKEKLESVTKQPEEDSKKKVIQNPKLAALRARRCIEQPLTLATHTAGK